MLILQLLTAFQAWGFDIMPLYRTHIDDRSISTSTTKIDSEYSSHILNYRMNLDDEIHWAEQNKILQVKLGSLSSKEFLVEKRLKLQQALTPNWNFGFYYFEEKNYEELAENIIWQFQRVFSNTYALDIFGQSSLEKEYSDIGLGLNVVSGVKNFRFTLQLPDFQKNKRQTSGETWVIEPLVIAGLSTTNTAYNFHTAYIRAEPKSKLQYASGTRLSREKVALGVNSRYIKDQDDPIDVQLHYDAKTEDQIEQRRLYMTISQHSFYDIKNLEVGLAGFYRVYDQDHLESTMTDILPFTWYTLFQADKEDHQSLGKLGIDLTYNKITDRLNIISAKSDESYESRLKYKHQIQFSDQGYFALLFTFDADEIGSGSVWEGGSGQFELFF